MAVGIETIIIIAISELFAFTSLDTGTEALSLFWVMSVSNTDTYLHYK